MGGMEWVGTQETGDRFVLYVLYMNFAEYKHWIPRIWYLEMGFMFFVTFFMLLGKPYLLLGYVSGIIINVILNIILKRWIAEPRPINNDAQFQILMKNHKNVQTEMFGMPSGHAQLSGFTFVYILLSTHTWWIHLLFGIYVIAVCIQRVITHAHSVLQVCVGLSIGVITAYGIYNVVVYFIKLWYPQGVEPNNSPFGSII